MTCNSKSKQLIYWVEKKSKQAKWKRECNESKNYLIAKWNNGNQASLESREKKSTKLIFTSQNLSL